MSPELKALLSLVFDGLKLGQDVLAKKNFVLMLPDVFALVSDAPAALAGFSDLQAEIAALADPAVEADLAAFVQQKVGAQVDSQKAQAIVAAALKLIQDGAQDVLALVAAIKA